MSIQANELRIGNLVGFDTCNKKHPQFYHVRVKRLLEKEVIINDPIDLEVALFYSGESLKPIPITPEILVACGFERNCSFFEKDGVQIMWGYTDKDGDFYHYTVDELVQYPCFNYIHQLQNLYFALTGKELEYKPTGGVSTQKQ